MECKIKGYLAVNHFTGIYRDVQASSIYSEGEPWRSEQHIFYDLLWFGIKQNEQKIISSTIKIKNVGT